MNVTKCAVKAKDHRAPAPGSVNDDQGTGTCPECLTEDVKLSKGGHIGAHAVKVEVDPTLPVVATGAPKGDPRDATVRRAVEARRITAGSDPMPTAPDAPEGREEGQNRTAASPGPALVRGRAMEPQASDVVTYRVGEPKPAPVPLEDSRTGFAASAGTMYGSTGRERMDREASTVPVVGGKYGYLTRDELNKLSRSQQRKYWAKVARMRNYADKRRHAAVASIPVRLGTGGIGGRSVADVPGDTERIMQQPPA